MLFNTHLLASVFGHLKFQYFPLHHTFGVGPGVNGLLLFLSLIPDGHFSGWMAALIDGLVDRSMGRSMPNTFTPRARQGTNKMPRGQGGCNSRLLSMVWREEIPSLSHFFGICNRIHRIWRAVPVGRPRHCRHPVNVSRALEHWQDRRR